MQGDRCIHDWGELVDAGGHIADGLQAGLDGGQHVLELGGASDVGNSLLDRLGGFDREGGSGLDEREVLEEVHDGFQKLHLTPMTTGGIDPC